MIIEAEFVMLSDNCSYCSSPVFPDPTAPPGLAVTRFLKETGPTVQPWTAAVPRHDR